MLLCSTNRGKLIEKFKGEKMIHRFVIDFLKEERREIEKKLKHYIQTKEASEKLRERIVEINRAIFILLKDARNK